MIETINWSYLILLTNLLTPDLDKLGCSWIRQPSTVPASRPVRQGRAGLDNPNLATDQEVGGSSLSERASEATGQGLAAGNGRGPEPLSGGLISHNFSQL